jgi:hypothetical protein
VILRIVGAFYSVIRLDHAGNAEHHHLVRMLHQDGCGQRRGLGNRKAISEAFGSHKIYPLDNQAALSHDYTIVVIQPEFV